MNMRAQERKVQPSEGLNYERERERDETRLILDDDDFMQTRRTSLGDAVDETFPLRGVLQVLRAATSIAMVRFLLRSIGPAEPVVRVQIARVTRIDDERQRAAYEAPRLIIDIVPANAAFRLRDTLMARRTGDLLILLLRFAVAIGFAVFRQTWMQNVFELSDGR